MSDVFAWGDTVARSESGGIPFLLYEPRRTRLPQLLEDAARWGSRPHLVQGDRRLSFTDVLSAIDVVGEHLRSLGVAAGDRILILAVNSPEWIVSLWAGLSIGAIVAPGNGWWSEEEVVHALDLTEPSLVIGDAKRLAKVPAGVATIDVDELRPMIDAAVTAGRSLQVPARVLEGDENDPALIVFTAGTTGLPKGATLAHRSWIATMHQSLAVSRRLPHTVDESTPGFVSLLTGPLFHIGGLQALGLALIGGGTLVFLEGKFDPGQVLEVIEREKVEVWGAIPTMTIRVLEHPSLPSRDLSSMRSIPLGGAPVSPELLERLQTAFPNTRRRVNNVYGMTETSGTLARASTKTIEEFPGTTGYPLPAVDLVIASPDDDGVGEILARTPGQMLGYWRDPAATAETIDAEGFVHSGDLGKLVDGRLYVTGRAKDVVIRGGENIAAPHVEAALHQHPDVADVAVVGLPHPDLGEEVAAAVLLRPGATAGPDELGAWARERIASFAVPTRWWFSEEPLPMTDAGKADKKRLRVIFPES
ncbi:3-[(3aS,4S,7aS)-7a-methyl-1,5-dioxo-octahydro-1H-inden-4-yl]propanoyl:CoA ligase [Paraconexibacter sp. AEG42_29]|uniref:3-[(3aS,4S,7aS)-7a-methyl-1, 5-dioxo-octahydro-1H-inden-4-yl]propanoyl:CoA ligase n=1 Tax=Paraconexibacter sp. AEG42_29 TaxID=2997339 RepID=A0AAU7AQQ1_9ACTN